MMTEKEGVVFVLPPNGLRACFADSMACKTFLFCVDGEMEIFWP